MRLVPVRTSTLRAGYPLLFDIYVHFKDSHLRFRNTNDQIDSVLLERLKAKNVKKIYILEEQEAAYLKYLDQALDGLKEGATTSLDSRSALAQGVIRQTAERISTALESEQEFRDSEARIQKVVDFFATEPQALAGMLAAEGLSVDATSHGSTVSTYALALGTACGHLGRDELTDLAIAALLHDSSLPRLGFEPLCTIDKVPKDRRAEFKKHPETAVELVAGKKFITPRVLRIISDHEEYGDGLGYPARKAYRRLQADSKVFNLCDAFDHSCAQAGKTAKENIEPFIEARADHFDAELIGLLESKVKV